MGACAVMFRRSGVVGGRLAEPDGEHGQVEQDLHADGG